MLKHTKTRDKRGVTSGIIVSKVLISVGISLILFSVGYEAFNYPWWLHFGERQEWNQNTLPDPASPKWNEGAVTYIPPSDESENLGSDSYIDFFVEPNRSAIQEVIGFLKITKLRTSVNIYEGATQDQLLLGAGHVKGTPMPGEYGNCCIAGHRVTRVMHPLRYMHNMDPGDRIFIIYNDAEYTYETMEVFVVGNKEEWVLQPVEGEERCLTLISCHPPGSARQRLILRARLIEMDG